MKVGYNFKNQLTQILPLKDVKTKTQVAKWLSQAHISTTESLTSTRNMSQYILISENKRISPKHEMTFNI